MPAWKLLSHSPMSFIILAQLFLTLTVNLPLHVRAQSFMGAGMCSNVVPCAQVSAMFTLNEGTRTYWCS